MYRSHLHTAVLKSTVLFLFSINSLFADNYTVELGTPNGFRVPAIIGASGEISGSQSAFTTLDYFQWYGITHHRFWFKPSYSNLNVGGGVTNPEQFMAATELIRQNPLKQGTSNDVYIDWSDFTRQCDNTVIEKMLNIGVMPMMVNTRSFSDNESWGDKFVYWQYWYAYVYYHASNYDITMYQFKNEPHAGNTFEFWKSLWLVCADAARKALADVNRDYNKQLKGGFNGPTEAGPYWNYNSPDFHGWGSDSWEFIRTDVLGNRDTTIWNYDIYDFHKYTTNSSDYVKAIWGVRDGIANANNDPNEDIPLTISEFNASTGGAFNKKRLDCENLYHAISLAGNLQATGSSGPSGLGDDGGIFLFKLGAPTTYPLLGNKTSYVSPEAPNNYGGITRCGACFQMYAHHYRGSKPLLSLTETSGSDNDRRSIAVVDSSEYAYYFYSSLKSDDDAKVTLDLSSLDVTTGAPVTVQRVDTNNVGQITDMLAVDGAKKVSFSSPTNTALLVKIPCHVITLSDTALGALQDSYLTIGAPGDHSTESTIKVSMHHSDPALRRVGLLKFALKDLQGSNRAILKLSGCNTGAETDQREIIHIYGAEGGSWTGQNLTLNNASGIGKYYASGSTLQKTTGDGDMVEIEDNYAGTASGKGLGIYGKFLGQISFFSPSFKENSLDVTDYIRSLPNKGKNDTVSFVLARIVRYNVNQYDSASYYRKGVYDYDTRCVSIGSSRNPDISLQPKLCLFSWNENIGVSIFSDPIQRPAADINFSYTGSGRHIRFALKGNLSKTLGVNISLFNMKGKEIRGADTWERGPNSSSANWTVRQKGNAQMTPGIYLYRAVLKTGNSKKIFSGKVACY